MTINPHGNKLVNLIVTPERAQDLRKLSRDLQSITLNNRQLSDLELLMNGAFSPLRGFMTSAEYNSVRDQMRLPDGTLWSMPICLDISEVEAESLKVGQLVALRDSEGFMVAVLAVEDIWQIDRPLEAKQVYGTQDNRHPGVDYLFNQIGTHYIGGAIEGIQFPLHFAFRWLRHTPAEIRSLYKKLGWRRIVGEALLHAIIRKNYGCTHFVIGPNHASPVLPDKYSFYEQEASKKLLQSFSEELGITIVPFDKMVYVLEEDAYMPANEVSPGDTVRALTDDEFHTRLRTGKRIPEWFTFPEVINVLQQAYPPRHKQGFTVFCTGLPGAGKSTIARVLYARFLEMGGRPITLLDGDIVRQNLSNELGFSKEDRDINVRRIGFVASEITKNRGIAICAPIAPYRETRRQIRQLIEDYGGFVEIHVGTPIETCETRDRKGLYAKARAGILKGFTGIDDPYEAPQNPEVFIDTTDMTPDEAAQEVLLYLERAGYIK